MDLSNSVLAIWPEIIEDNEKIRPEEMESKMGGEPTWLLYKNDDQFPECKCSLCNQDLKFMLQLNCPTDSDEAYFRTLYVFICPNGKCGGNKKSIRVFRAQLPKENEYVAYNEAQDQFELKMEYNSEEIHKESLGLIEQEYVLIDQSVSKEEQKLILDDGNDEEATIQEGGKNNTSVDSLEDKSFQAFQKSHSDIKDQVLRYSYSETSQPLFYSDYDQFELKDIPKCPKCGCKRAFEFQIHNQILSHFPSLINLNWGIAAIFTCSKSCTVSSDQNRPVYIEEHVEIQMSPDEVDRIRIQKMQKKMMDEFREDMNADGAEIEEGEESEFLKEMMMKEEMRRKREAKRKMREEMEEIEEDDEGIFGGDGDDDDDDGDWD